MHREDTLVPAAEGFEAIRDFESDHKIHRDPVIAWHFPRGRSRPTPVTACGVSVTYIAIEYPDGRVLDLAKHKLFHDSDDWLKAARKGWSEGGAP